MRFFKDNTCYLFTITKEGNDSDATEGFHIEILYRRSQESLPQALGTQEKKCLHIPNAQQFGHMAEQLMTDILQHFQIPENILADMSLHFKFHLFGSRLYCRGSYNVIVRLDVKAYTAERAAVLQRRMESSRRLREEERERRRREMVEREVLALQPTDKTVVERLEREVVEVVNGDQTECSICLEKIIVGVEVMKLPCLHFYHTNCIIKWLDRNHFCPYCRFELPC